MVVIGEEPRRYAGIIFVQSSDPTESYEFGAVIPGQFWLQTSVTSDDPYPILFLRINDGESDIWQRLTAPGIVTCTELPIPAEALRGHLRLLQGGDGAADTLQCCVKDATDQYIWAASML